MKVSAVVVSLLLAGVLTLVLCRATLAENPNLLQGIEKFNAGAYAEAARLFRKGETAEPSNALLHYYLAESLVKLNQENDAIREYRQAESLAPNSQIAEYSRTALAALGASPAVSAGPQSGSLKTDAAAKEGMAHEWLSNQIQQVEDQRKIKLDEAQRSFTDQFDALRNETTVKKADYAASHTVAAGVGPVKGSIPQEVYDSGMAAIDQENADKQLDLNKTYKRKQQEINAGFDAKEKALRDSMQVYGTAVPQEQTSAQTHR